VSVVQGVLSYGIVRGVPVRWCGYQRVCSLPPVLAYRMVALLAGYLEPLPHGARDDGVSESPLSSPARAS